MSRIGSTIDSIWSLAFEGWVNVPGCLIHSCDHEQSCCLVSHSFRINHREVGHGQTFGSDVTDPREKASQSQMILHSTTITRQSPMVASRQSSLAILPNFRQLRRGEVSEIRLLCCYRAGPLF